MRGSSVLEVVVSQGAEEEWLSRIDLNLKPWNLSGSIGMKMRGFCKSNTMSQKEAPQELEQESLLSW